MAAMPKTLTDLPWPRRTDRLVLRLSTPADEAAVFAYRSLPEVSEWLTGLDDDREQFAKKFADPEWAARTLLLEHDGAVIGDVMVKVQDAWAQAERTDEAKNVEAELGWVLSPGAAGNGFAAEAATELLRICFDDLGLRRVVAICFADNDRSWRLMERLGMRRESAMKADSLHRSGEWVDSYTYAVLADEWRAAQP